MKKLSNEEMKNIEGGRVCQMTVENNYNLSMCRTHAKRNGHTYDYVGAQTQCKNGKWCIVYNYTV